ncbi:MAG: polyphosphate kinase 1 [Ignavibacteria bacterium]|nr:polyphosphate kinase 1 [Ignavibacteria bacterium]
MNNSNLYNRELSWLSFNYRVLQEAKDLSVPLYERIKFIAIFSSNLDEFFRVRVASLRSLLTLKKKSKKNLKFDPVKLLIRIHNIVYTQQEEYGKIFREQIIPELIENNIFLINEKDLNSEQGDFVKNYFKEKVLPCISPAIIVDHKTTPFLKNGSLYLVVKLSSKKIPGEIKENNSDECKFAFVKIPSDKLPRFVQLPVQKNKHFIIFLDDIIRYNLADIFSEYEIESAYSVKLTRDAELYIDDEFTGNLLEKIKKNLKNRSTGIPCRFLFDQTMPQDFLKCIKDSLLLSTEDLIPGARYHNFNDFFSFPNPGFKELEYKPLPPLNHKELDSYSNIFDAWKEKEFLLHYPYHSFDYVIKALETAAEDPLVKEIKITQYRFAKDSSIVKALLKAIKNGKSVTIFCEIKARFDEEANLEYAKMLENAGAKVLYSFPGIKVHSKIAMITRMENEKKKYYLYLATGNFNEKTARIYCDYGLFTSDKKMAKEINEVFDYLEGKVEKADFKNILVSQFNMRQTFTDLIDNEIKNAQKGKPASMILKMNSLEDSKIIRKLYEANKAGVKIDLIVRGICRLVPGIKGLSDSINVISIVDRFLEHARVYIFQNNGNEIIYLASADWMKRNLSRRIEVGFSINDSKIKKEIKDVIALQLKDNVKARIINQKQNNKYKQTKSKKSIRSQYKTYEYYENSLANKSKKKNQSSDKT